MADFAANLDVFIHVGPDDNCVRAEFQRLEHRHCRFDAVNARDIASGGDNAALAAADDDRQVADVGVVAFLHRGVERVTVDMGDGKLVKLCMNGEARAAASRAAPLRGCLFDKAVAAKSEGEAVDFFGHRWNIYGTNTGFQLFYRRRG